MKKQLLLNVKFVNNQVKCAKSPVNCKGCNDINKCERMIMSYNPFQKGDMIECFKNNERRR